MAKHHIDREIDTADVSAFIYVDVESRNYVRVYGCPLLDNEGVAKDFEGPNAFDRACAYAKAEAKRLKPEWGVVDWGSNEWWG